MRWKCQILLVLLFIRDKTWTWTPMIPLISMDKASRVSHTAVHAGDSKLYPRCLLIRAGGFVINPEWAPIIIVPHRIIWSWYTGRWWVGYYIWYSEDRTGRGRSPPSPLLAVPNVTAHPSRASAPIIIAVYWSVAVRLWCAHQRVKTMYWVGTGLWCSFWRSVAKFAACWTVFIRNFVSQCDSYVLLPAG